MAGRKRNPGRPLGEDEARLFAAAMKDVTPLASSTRPPAPPAPSTRPPAPPAVRPPATPPPPGADVDARTRRRLRRGEIRPQARLDLHGMTVEAAHAAVAAFIVRARAEGRRCVLVITGTGRWREGAGILRSEVPGWLSAPALRDHVRAFSPARPADGGDGALYVLLRAPRRHG